MDKETRPFVFLSVVSARDVHPNLYGASLYGASMSNDLRGEGNGARCFIEI